MADIVVTGTITENIVVTGTITENIKVTGTIQEEILITKTLDELFTIVDPDAAAFIAAAGITDQNQKDALNTLVLTLKDKEIYSLIEVMHPIVGGTADSHSFNLIDPTKFQVNWIGNPTHSANGVDYNGINQFGKTGFIPSISVLVNANSHGMVYQRETGASNFHYAFGASQPADFQFFMNPRQANDIMLVAINGKTANISNGITDDRGLMAMDKVSSGPNNYRSYRNGLLLNSFNTGTSNRSPTIELYLGARNINGTAVNITIKQAAFYSFGATLGDQKHLDYYNAIQAFQTSLGRNV